MAGLLLFDIDMTLIRTAGAGRAAMNTALERLSGVAQATAGIRFDGRTDRGIFLELMALHGLESGDPEAAFESFVAEYIEELPRHLAAKGASSSPVCPPCSTPSTNAARSSVSPRATSSAARA